MKHTYPVLLFLLLFFSPVLKAQNTFQADYSFGSFSIPILTNIIQNPSGHYIMTGTDGTLPIRGTLTELDSAANVVFSKEYVSSIQTEIVDAKNVTFNGGGYIVAGESNPGLVLMRLDSNANVVWANTYHVGGPTEENASRVIPTSDHGFVVAGYVYEATPPGYARQDSANCYALKVDSNGNLLWAKVIFCSVTYINDHLFNDVAEAADGYVFVGSMSEAHSDASGTYNLVVKTDFNGNVIYMKHWGGASSADGEATSIASLSTTTQLIGGDDNSQSYVINFNSTSGTGTGFKYGNGILPPYLNFNAVPTYDGNYAMVGMAPLGFESYLMKVNASTGAVIWGEEYNGGFASILPEGRQVSDSGMIMVTTALGTGGYDYLVVKTNSAGTTSPAGCTPTSFSPSKSANNPTYTAFPLPDSLTGSTRTNFTPTIVNVHPSDSINCIHIVCTPPAAPSASANPGTICNSQSSTITGSGGGTGAVYNVYTSATGGTSLGTTPLSVSPTSTTTYYVDESSTAGCVSTTRTPVTITVNQAPGTAGPITGNTAVCTGGATYTINPVTNATTYAWSISGGGTITSGTNSTVITVNWTTAGSYTVSVTAGNTCGNSTATATVNVSAAPVSATASAGPNPVCAGNNDTLSVTSAGATTYAWSGPGGYSSGLQNPVITAIQAAQSGTYTVSASNTCGTATATVNLVVNSAPGAASASASPNPVCSGQNLLLSASSTAATTWAWSGPGGYSSASPNPTINGISTAQAGTYTVTASNTCGTATASVSVSVNTAPTAVSASAAPDTVCVGSPINLMAGATGATTYAWSGPNGFTSNQQSPTISGAVTADAGTYTLTAGNTCGNTTATVTVSVITSPTAVNATASTNLACFGSSVNFTGSASGAGSYSWTGPNGFSSNAQNPSIPSATEADSGTYILTATNVCGHNTASVTVSIDTFIQNLSATVTPGDTLCTGSNIALHAGGINVNTWLWTGPNGYNSQQENPVITGSTTGNSGQYIVTGTNACGSVKDTVNVLVQSSVLTLQASSNVANDSACSGAQVNLMATGSNFNTYVWTGPNGFISTHQDTTLHNVMQAQTGYYTVTGNNSCGTLSDSVLIHIDSLPVGLQISSNAAGNSTCQGQSITVTASSTGTVQWSWTGPAAFSANQASFTLQNPQPGQQGLYIVTATNSCGTSRDSVNVTVLATPDTLHVSASSDSICPGSSVTLNAAGNLTGVVWNTTQTGNSISVSTPGIYYYTATNSNNCSVRSDTITVHSAVAPALNLFGTNPNTICQGQQSITLVATSDPHVVITWYPGGVVADTLVVPDSGTYVAVGAKNGCTVADTLTLARATVPTVSFNDTSVQSCCLDMVATPVISGGSNYTYVWSDSSTGSTVNLSQTGHYTVTVTTGAGCTATAAVNFNKVCLGAIASATPDTIYVENTSQLNVTTTVTGHLSYMWSPADSLSNPLIPNPSASPKLSTLYTVIVTDSVSGCTDTTSTQLTVLYNANFGIPNVFSPNVPGPNDHWYVINQAGLVTVQDIKIFDRWGTPVFLSERDGSIEWDGKYKGKLQPMGNYVYMVQLKINATGEEKNLKGNLAVIW